MKKLLFLLATITLLIISCRKDNMTTNIDFVPENEETIETELVGQVINADGEPISDAMISLSGTTTATNEDGIFRIETIELGTNGELVIIEKDGFYTNIKRILPTENETFIKLGLTLKVNSTGSFQASEGGVISRQGKEKITFEPNSIVDESGNSYTGEVSVFTDFFNKDKPYLEELMPGDLSGLNQQGTQVQLETYSMVLVELFGENGEELNLKEGTTANIEFPISQQTPNPPAEIALWSLNENTGLWIEEGTATFDGNTYQGEVSHFSFWNCDAPFPTVNLKGRFIDLDGNPLAYRKVNISFIESGILRSAYTNKDGEFSGVVPADRILGLTILNTCEASIYDQEIGPFRDDTVLPDIAAEIIENITQISGQVMGCAGQPVMQGFVTITDDFGRIQLFETESDGSFAISYINCGTTNYKIKGADAVEFTESPEKTFIDKGQTSINAGTFTACDEISEFVSINVDGESSILSNADVFIFTQTSSAIISNFFFDPNELGTDKAFQLFLNTITPGEIFPTQFFYGFLGSSNSNIVTCDIDLTCDPNFKITLTQTDDFVGGFWTGTGTGHLWSESQQLVPAFLSFKIPVRAISSQISGTLWHDTNKNGLQDTGEPPFTDASIRFEYINVSGNLESFETAVSATGTYSEILPVSDVSIDIRIIDLNLSNYSVTQQDVGNDDTVDSDFDPMDRSIKNFQFISQQGPFQLDCGIIER